MLSDVVKIIACTFLAFGEYPAKMICFESSVSVASKDMLPEGVEWMSNVNDVILERLEEL